MKYANPIQKTYIAFNKYNEAIHADPTVQSLKLQLENISRNVTELRNPIREIQSEIAELKPQKEQLEKDVNRINHELERATQIKEYADKSLKYFEDNKDEIISKFASNEIGGALYAKRPDEYDDELQPPLYDTKVSELELASDPDPVKFYRDIYRDTL